MSTNTTLATPAFPQGFAVAADDGTPVFYQGDYYDTATANAGPQTRAYDTLDIAATAPGSYRLSVNGGVALTLVDLTTGGDTSLVISLGGQTAPRGDTGVIADANSYILADLRSGRGDFGIYHNGADGGYAEFVGVTTYQGFRGDVFVGGVEVEYTGYDNPGYVQLFGQLLDVHVRGGADNLHVRIEDPTHSGGPAYGVIEDTGRLAGDVTIELGDFAFATFIAQGMSPGSTLHIRDVGKGPQALTVIGDVAVVFSAGENEIFDIRVHQSSSPSGSSALGFPAESAPADPYAGISDAVANDAGVAAIIGQLGNVDLSGTFF